MSSLQSPYEPTTHRNNLNALVESLLAQPGVPDTDPEFSRAEVRSLVLQAIKATWDLHPKIRQTGDGYSGFEQVGTAQSRLHYTRTVEIACDELERGFRGTTRPS